MPTTLEFPKAVSYRATIHGPGKMTVADEHVDALIDLGGVRVGPAEVATEAKPSTAANEPTPAKAPAKPETPKPKRDRGKKPAANEPTPPQAPGTPAPTAEPTQASAAPATAGQTEVNAPQGEQKPAGDTPPQGAGTPGQQASGTPLPEDFPSRDVLSAAGLATVEAVKAAELVPGKVPGVGPSTIARIQEALGG